MMMQHLTKKAKELVKAKLSVQKSCYICQTGKGARQGQAFGTAATSPE
jgi:hypothetical protein